MAGKLGGMGRGMGRLHTISTRRPENSRPQMIRNRLHARDAALLAITALALAWSAAAAALPTSRSSEVVAVYPPWWPEARVLGAASRSADLLSFGRWSFVVLARAPDIQSRSRLAAGGALLVLDGGVSKFCGKGEGNL